MGDQLLCSPVILFLVPALCQPDSMEDGNADELTRVLMLVPIGHASLLPPEYQSTPVHTGTDFGKKGHTIQVTAHNSSRIHKSQAS